MINQISIKDINSCKALSIILVIYRKRLVKRPLWYIILIYVKKVNKAREF